MPTSNQISEPLTEKKLLEDLEKIGITKEDLGFTGFERSFEPEIRPARKYGEAEMMVTARLYKRVQELEDAIRKHYKNFPDEPLLGETELWSHVGINVSVSEEGRFFKGK